MAKLVYGHVMNNGVKLHYYRTLDEKQPILFLHGITGSGLCWGETALAFQNYYDVILMDARGHGLSDKPAEGYGEEDRIADVMTVMDQLALEQVPIVGHSMGAETAALVAARYPQRVKALILEDPPFMADESNETPERKQQRVSEFEEALAHYNCSTLAELLAEGRKSQPGWSEADLFQWAKAKKNSSPNLAEILKAPRRHWKSYFGSIKCPVLLLTGEKDSGAIITREVAKAITGYGRHISEVNFPATAHNIRFQRFGDYYEALKKFLWTNYPI